MYRMLLALAVVAVMASGRVLERMELSYHGFGGLPGPAVLSDAPVTLLFFPRARHRGSGRGRGGLTPADTERCRWTLQRPH